MRVAISEIAPSLHVAVRGNESWLAALYADVPHGPEQGGAELLTADLDLHLEQGGSVSVRGQIDYAPQLNCARCGQLVRWPLAIAVDARFMPESTQDAPKEKNLSRKDLDLYYLEDDTVDLAQLINDVVQIAIPSRVIPDATLPGACTCHLDADDDRVYASDASPDTGAPASPFAVLKGLKLPN